MSLTRAKRAEQTEQLRASATANEQAADAADAAGRYDLADAHLKQAGKDRERLNWLHVR